MFLLIDAGNTRTKFGCHNGDHWLVRDVMDDTASDADDIMFALPADFVPTLIIIANVAGESVAARLKERLTLWQDRIEWLRPSATRCGVVNRYEPPQSLGADRWAAAIGAWQLIGNACLVVSAGTATTIDVLEADGVFAGGIILPGLSMMKASLVLGTANLPQAQDNESSRMNVPCNTHDAITAGCIHAQLGAVERMTRLLPANSPIVVTGGAATQLISHLGAAAMHAPWLVLDGLLRIATEHR
ncbi:MAG TPA: type III pantothenate kinase [Rhodocyclaceae bacterium]|nr:type III pantothenate kinase [Rhodocyclaceae bacterium]